VHPDATEQFVIVIPPPNVTGSLHIGHALTCSIQDSIVRWHRMQGKAALWLPGTDHAGIATQVVVEKRLAKESPPRYRHDMTREAFLAEVWKWKAESGSHISNQLRLTGASVDWDRECFTMDDKLSRAVTEAFVRLEKKKLIYREKKLVDWCCRLQSVISKLEVDQIEVEAFAKVTVPGYDKKVDVGFLFQFAYKFDENRDEEIVVATTRPETMLGDTAVAVHPEDPRYKKYHGKFVVHPFTGRRLPIITDSELVDMSFGTGAVKITPAHDPNDFLAGQRHKLEFVDVLTDDGNMNENCGPFAHMKRFDARYAVMEALDQVGLGRGEKGNPMKIPVCSRTGDLLEPRIKMQWYCDCREMAARSTKAVRDGELKLIGKDQENKWFQWLDNIQDWCISRQLWWGHRIPAWFVDFKGEPKANVDTDTDRWVVGHDEAGSRELAAKKFGKPADSLILSQDPDCLDTWFSSALFPFSTMGWPDNTPDMKKYYPGHLLETGNDILFFWVARMVMFGLELTDQLPFKDVFLHTIVRDKYGDKMSKSKGNVIDPIWVAEGQTLDKLHENLSKGTLNEVDLKRAQDVQAREYPNGLAPCGSDGLRFALLFNTTYGSDINLDINVVVAFRQFCNKMWQATRFGLKYLEGFKPAKKQTTDTAQLPLMARWILSRLNTTVTATNEAFAKYDMHEVTAKPREFFLEDFCNSFIEQSKGMLNNPEHPDHKAMQEVLYTCFDTIFRLMHPMLPFITEELWQRLARRPGDNCPSIMIAAYPKPIDAWHSPLDEKKMAAVNEVVHAVQSLKSSRNMTPKQLPEVFVKVMGPEAAMLAELFEASGKDVAAVARCEVPKVLKDQTAPNGCASKVVDQTMAVYMNLAGMVDTAAEQKKLLKEIDNKRAYLDKLDATMNNPNYHRKPPAAQEKDKAKREEAASVLAQLEEEYTAMGGAPLSGGAGGAGDSSVASGKPLKPMTPKKLKKKDKKGRAVQLTVANDGTVSVTFNYDALGGGSAFTALPPLNRHKMTTLHQAAEQGDATAVSQLLGGGADPDQAMEFDWTPLHCAALGQHTGAIQALVAGKCDLDAQTEDGMTPLHLCASKGLTAQIKFLMQAGADPAVRTRNGSCAHDTAAAHGFAETARALPQVYEADADFDEKSSVYYYERPVWNLDALAANEPITVPVREMLSFKADPKAQAEAGKFGQFYGVRCVLQGSQAPQGATAPQVASPATKDAHIAAVTGDEKKQGKKSKKEKKGKEEKKVDPAEEKKKHEKHIKAVIKEGGKKGVEVEGAADMGGMAFFCTMLKEPEGDLEELKMGFAAMNAIPDPNPDEERRGGAGGVGKMVFSAGAQYLSVVCNVPAELQKDKPMDDAPTRQAMHATEWVQYVLAKFSKEAPGLKVMEGSDAGFASAQIPANKDIGFFPLKIDADALSYAYELLRSKNCVSLNDSSSDGVVHGDFEDDY